MSDSWEEEVHWSEICLALNAQINLYTFGWAFLDALLDCKHSRLLLVCNSFLPIKAETVHVPKYNI